MGGRPRHADQQLAAAATITPLAPAAALAHGTVTLNVLTSPITMTISFPAPCAFSVVGDVDTNKNTVTFSSEPDVPLTSLAVDLTGTAQGRAYQLTSCAPANVVAKFTGQGGQSKTDTVPVQYQGCSSTPPPPPTVGSPTASGSLRGLASRHPSLRLHLSHGTNAPKLRSVSIGVGSGLSFKRSAILKHKHCTGTGSKRKCSTTITAKGLSISGGKLKRVRLKGGKLLIMLKRPASATTIKVGGPLLSESKSLQKRVKKHQVKHLSVHVKMTDASGKSTTRTLHLKA